MQTDTAKKISTADLTKMSMCVALCCISANIFFPLPFTPAMVTALTIFLSLAAYILTPKKAAAQVLKTSPNMNGKTAIVAACQTSISKNFIIEINPPA